MSATPWTPGPWIVRVAGPNNYPYAITAPHVPWDKKGAIRDITRWAAISMPSSAEGQANARLIAGAPEMAEALEQTAAAMDALHPSAAGDMNDADYARLWNSTREALDAILFRIRGDAT